MGRDRRTLIRLEGSNQQVRWIFTGIDRHRRQHGGPDDLEEKLAEVTGLAGAAQETTKKVETMLNGNSLAETALLLTAAVAALVDE